MYWVSIIVFGETILKQSKTTYEYVLERSEEQVSVRGIPNRTDVYVDGERLYSGVALELGQILLRRISCSVGTTAGTKAEREEAARCVWKDSLLEYLAFR